MITSKVGQRGQITLPRSVRQWLGLSAGDRVAFIRRGDEIVLQPLNRTLLELRGSVPVSGPQDFEEIRQQMRAAHARQVAEENA